MAKKLFQIFFAFFVITIPLTTLVTLVPQSAFAQSATDLGIGTVNAPPGTEAWVTAAQAEGQNIALIFFISNMIKLFSVVMGIWVIFNVLLAGYSFLSTDSSGAFEKARVQITQSAVGLMLIVLAYTFTGLIGLIFFGDAAIFLNPTLIAAP
jgi:hypothetical protein